MTPAALLIAALVVASLVPRFTLLDEPLLERNAFRQTQTAMTVWAMARGSMSPFAFETPILGPPWRVPLEFPLFQMTAASLVRLGVQPLEAACRIAGVIWFAISSVVFYALCRLVLGAIVARSAWLVYVLAPYMILWSRTSMIDFSSVTFSLGYVLAVVAWLRRRPAPWLLAVAIGSGIMAYLTKVTTVPTVLPALALLSLSALRETGRGVRGWDRRMLGGLALAAVIPFVAGLAWTLYTASVRDASPFTAEVASRPEWFFGTWKQRLTAASWERVLPYFGPFLPGPFLLLVPLGLWPLRDRDGRWFVYGMVAGAVVTVLLFFNLYYWHDYYLMAVAPAVCLVMGIGVHRLLVVAPRGRPALAAAAACLVLVMYGWFAWPMVRNRHVATRDHEVVQLAKLLRRTTRPNELVVIGDFDWNPAILLQARRRGLMLRPWLENAKTKAMIAEYPFRAVVVEKDHPVLFSVWPHHREVGQVGRLRVFRVADDPAGLELPTRPGGAERRASAASG